MDEDEELEGYVEIYPQKWSPWSLVRAVSLFACGVTQSLAATVDYLDTTIAAHQAHSDEQRNLADSVRIDLEQL